MDKTDRPQHEKNVGPQQAQARPRKPEQERRREPEPLDLEQLRQVGGGLLRSPRGGW